jgi:hypothetical protein
VKDSEKIAPPAPGSSWTRPDDYIGAMARKRTYRRAREGQPRSDRATSRAGLATVPLAAILAVLAVLVVAIMIVAFPGTQPEPRPNPPAVHEQGVAAPGWFQKAQKEMHR